MRGTLDEPMPHTLPQPLSESGRGRGNENAFKLERDMQLAFKEQEKSSSSALAVNSSRPCRPSIKPPYPQTKQEHDRGRTSCNILEELGHGPRRRNQDRGEEAREQQ
jgi:hypothetical protein